MLTHRITLPDGTEIEFFTNDEAIAQQCNALTAENTPFFTDFNEERQQKRSAKLKAKAKKARKQQKQARRKQR